MQVVSNVDWTKDKSIYDNFFKWHPRYNELLMKVQKLEVRDITLVVSDFDDTLYWRYEQLQSVLLAANRWKDWNILIEEKLWWYKICADRFFDSSKLVWKIVEKIRNNISLILSAWIEEYQNYKIENVWLDDLPRVIVGNHLDKPLALLEYLIDELWFIPSKIEFYDDRAEELLDDFKKLSSLLNNKISVFKVMLDKMKFGSMEELTY